MRNRAIILISGMFALIIIGSIVGYFTYQYYTEEEKPECDLPYNQICLAYNQWKHTTNTNQANFSIYDTNKALLWDVSSISSISASLKFPEIAEGELSLQLQTFGDPFLNYPNEMNIDFKADGRVLFTLFRQKYGSYIVRHGNNLIKLQSNTLALLTFELTWNFTKPDKPITFALKRHVGDGFSKYFTTTENVITKSMGIDEIRVFTTTSAINSGTLFYLANSHLKNLGV